MLLIHAPADSQSIYSHYLAAILRLEGFADAEEADVAAIDTASLAAHDLVILSRLSATAEQCALFRTYVAQGGRLLVCQPDVRLARHLGMRPTYATVRDGYLHLDPAQSIITGLCVEPVQVIVPATGWVPDDGAAVTILGMVRSGREASTSGIPGIVLSRIGAGSAILLAYDLPHAVARLRQGDPANADLHGSGVDGVYRPSELFVGQLDPQQLPLPQADLHTALLARLIETLAPRPRLWYYPSVAQRSTMIMTSDDDWSSLAEFDTFLAGLRQRQAHCSFHIIPETNVTPALLDAWEQEGHSFTVHPALDTEIRAPLDTSAPQALAVPQILAHTIPWFRAQFGREVRTIRHHAVRWSGYVEAARLLAERGVRLDCNYLSSAPFPLGYFAGSGRPLPFVDTNGQIIPLLQQPTLWTEECLIHPDFAFSSKWSVERALAETTALTHRAAREFYTPVTINSHPVSFATYSQPLIEGAWDAALAERLPIISAHEWLDWTEARNAIRIVREGAGWVLRAGRAVAEVTMLMPEDASVSGNGGAVSEQRLWGRRYRAVTITGLVIGEWCRIGCPRQ